MAINAQKMIDAIECALATNAGVVSVTVDGQTIRYDRRQAIEELKYWESKNNIEKKTRIRSGQIRLNNIL